MAERLLDLGLRLLPALLIGGAYGYGFARWRRRRVERS